MKYLYHGSGVSDLRMLDPEGSAGFKKYVYATTYPAFAAIFIDTPSSSLLGTWDVSRNGKPYFCELVEGIFATHYENKSGSIYTVDRSLFSKRKEMWAQEYISTERVPIIREEKIPDIKTYMKSLEKKGEFRLVTYAERFQILPNYNDRMLDLVLRGGLNF